MKIQIQVVENSDRYHVLENGYPVKIIFKSSSLSPFTEVCAYAYVHALGKIKDGFDVELLQSVKK